jgi:hypothetical protein
MKHSRRRLAPRSRRCIFLLMLIVSLAGRAAVAAITVDGITNEPEWTEARVYTDFVVTEPLTRAQPRYATELRILPRPEALYVAMRFTHPASERTHGRAPRDSPNMAADPAILLIDFEGQGNTAYEFTVSLSGTQRDSIVLKQSQISRDWDASWIARTHEDAEGWTAEWEIPWSVAPEGVVNGDKRTIGFYAARYVKKDSQRYALPAIELLASTFVRDFRRIEIPRYRAASLDWFPYASVARDNLSGVSKARAGLDVVWRPSGQNQLSAALLPDFGQVESDNLVVNFSAIETFFDEKRPFFTEGQQLFDLRTTQNGRLVNTRRIGAAADAGPDGSTEVLFAGKYTGTQDRNEYGVFTAIENDPRDAQGRRYAVGRYHFKAGTASFGWLGSYTQRPTLDRNALVQSVDYDWRFGSAWTMNGQSIVSDIRQHGQSERGYGSWLTADYQPGGRWQHSLALTRFDRRLNFNDLGFQQRADISEVMFDSQYFIRSYSRRSWADNGNWHLNVRLGRNGSGEALQAPIELGHYFAWRNGAGSYVYYVHEISGVDDLISRGNGSVRIPSRHHWGASYETRQAGKFRWQAFVHLEEQGISGWTRQLEFDPTFFITESLSIGAELIYAHSDDWLLWVAGNSLARYRRDDVTTRLNLNWFPAPRQELRFKLQWLGLSARVKQGYQIAADRRLVAAQTQASNFTFNNLGLQLRYRYELQPLSDLYVVYSRGGDGSLDDRDEALGSQFRRAWDHRTADQLSVKLRYRFH